MRPQSAKAKGRNLQKYVVALFLEYGVGLEPDDIKYTSMGASGEDIQMSPAARRQYPLSIECKNTESLNIWKAIDQATSNAKGNIPTVIFTKNKKEAFIAVPLDYYMEIVYAKKYFNFFKYLGDWVNDRVTSWSKFVSRKGGSIRTEATNRHQEDNKDSKGKGQGDDSNR